MAILQTKKQTDIEKRLRLLRQQVYGKEFGVSSPRFAGEAGSSELGVKNKTSTNSELKTTNYSSDISYLYTDLLKIGVFATVAIGAQLILFFTFFKKIFERG